MPKEYYSFICSKCGKKFTKWQGQCPSCLEWNTLQEYNTQQSTKSLKAIKTHSLDEIEDSATLRTSTGSREFDRVLGGGFVKGSAILIGGEPGIGKSTLLLKTAHNIAKKGETIYVSGEESLEQIKIRAERLKINSSRLKLLNTNELADIINLIETEKPNVLVIDSIQTVYSKELDTSFSSASQLKNTVSVLIDLAKAMGVSLFLVGHITKEGQIAGPKLIEHMVDVVIYFENDSSNMFRILRATKNRYGTTNEIAIFEMTSLGLNDVDNPSLLFLPDIDTSENIGASIGSVLTGNRNIFVEVQTLISHSYTAMPRRTVVGYENNRVATLLAVMEKYLDYNFSSYDIFTNIAGGIKVKDTALDLGIVVSIISSYLLKPLMSKSLFIGELSLTGKIKTVPKLDYRIKEARRLGFENFLIPANSKLAKIKGVVELENIKDLPNILFNT